MLITEFNRIYLEEGLSSHVIELFRKLIYAYFKNKRRDFPFRKEITPYNVLVSEIMLQQTQTGRVAEKYLEFKGEFPDFLSLSNASNEKLLKVWQGMGYNRRALALKQIAKIVINEYSSKLPDSVDILKTFPQIGHNTASSIVAFAYNKPSIFIETNIRRVYIYYFFPKKKNINDKDILPIVENTVDNDNPREWYYALMDYGVMLKKTHPELNKRSSHYRKQSPFKGSNREIRGKILKILTSESEILESTLSKKLQLNLDKMRSILQQLEKEGFIKRKGNKISI
jgi:A/G-specific adenine glycosylase